jgi:formate dehydrogenase maturation protein FdhE
MEEFISIAGSLAILLIMAIAGWVAYMLIFRKRPGKTIKEQQRIGLKICPLCGSPMKSLINTPHVIHCIKPGCPNYLDDAH